MRSPRTLLRSALLLAACLSAAPLFAQRIPHGQDKLPGPALSPQEALAKMTAPEGFSVELVASEPQIVNPVAMTFDERGRIWVTESLEYPRKSPGPGQDKVKILEDTDRDGKIDKVTVFLEGLNIPSGIAVGHGGVWVVNAPDLLFVQDTNGDGKADKQEVVVTGWGRADTHELANSLTWGPDGWLYGLNGVFNPSHVKYPEGSPLAKSKPDGWRFTAAMFRIHPRTREFQVFAEGTSNPWGIAFDNEGSAFVSACVIDHLWHIVETGYYHRQGALFPPYTWKIESIVKEKHQKAAYCGLHFFDSDAYPEPYREKLYMGNIHGACINVDKLKRDGSTYAGTNDIDFISANDAWFMPVVQKTGPDGCLYVLDWYDQYHCYQDANRDPQGIERGKGRLYRVRYKDTPRAPAFDLTKETDDQLIERLKSPNVFFRDIAQRLLSERSSDPSREKLERMVFDEKIVAKSRMHALWALAGMKTLSEKFVVDLLHHSDSVRRAWGVRLLAHIGVGSASPSIPPVYANANASAEQRLHAELTALASRETAPDVLLQIAMATREFAPPEALRMLGQVLASPASGKEPLLPRIVWQNLHPLLEEHGDEFLEALPRDARLETPAFAAVLPRLTERILGRKKATGKMTASLFKLLEGHDRNAARWCLEQLAARIQSGEIRGEQLAHFQEHLAPLIAPHIKAGSTDPLSLDAALVAVSWKNQTALEFVRQTFNSGTSAESRIKALQALIADGDSALFTLVPPVLNARPGSGEFAARGDAEFRRQLLDSLGKLDDPRVGEIVLAAYKQLPADVQPAAINTLTQRANWAKQLLKSVAGKEIPAEALNVNQVRKILDTRDAELVAAVTKQWGTLREERNPQRETVIAEMRALIRRTPGDAQRGQEAFKKVCGQCHKIFGEGQEVGPDITFNGRNSYDQLLSNVFDPSLVIGAGYQGRTIVTTKGRVVSGLVAEESDQRVVLKVQGGKQEVIPRDEIEEMSNSKLSLMPEDVEKTLKPQEIVDLFAFITLDKPPADPAGKQLGGVYDIAPRNATNPDQFAPIIAEVAPGFTLPSVGERGLGLLKEHMGRPAVMRTHPLDRNVPCTLNRTIDLPAGKKAKLLISVSHDPQGDWQLIVKGNGKKLHDSLISRQTTTKGWTDVEIDLSPFAGEKVKLELDNFPNNWSNEFGYWSRVDIVTE